MKAADPNVAAEWDRWIEMIRTDGLNLTKWELEFVASVAAQRASGRTLSDRQADLLEKIYAERTP